MSMKSWTTSTVNPEDCSGGVLAPCFTKPWDHNPFFLDATAGVSELSAAWRWETGGTEVGHLVTYWSRNRWTPAEEAGLQSRLICHALLDILPAQSLQSVFEILQAECLHYKGIDPATGFLALSTDDDPYENAGTTRMTKQSARLLNSVLRARPSEPDERKR